MKTEKIYNDVYDSAGKKVSTMQIQHEAINQSSKDDLITRYIRVYLANQRVGSASTKTRGEVSGSTRKIYRQKGTGRARHGDIKAPIFVGGGIALGPTPRDFRLSLNKKMRKKALILSIVDRFKNNKFLIIKGISEIKPKTKEFIKIIKKITPDHYKKDKLLLLVGKDKNLQQSARNIKNLEIADSKSVNTYQIINNNLIISDLKYLEELFKNLGLTFSLEIKDTKISKKKTTGK